MLGSGSLLDYGFIKQPSGIDLINHRRKIVIELKNGYRINSIVRRVDLQRLQEFKAQHPRYTVILGFINDKNPEVHLSCRMSVSFLLRKIIFEQLSVPCWCDPSI